MFAPFGDAFTFGTLMYLARQAGVEVKKRDEKVQSAKVHSISSSHERERGRVYNRCDDGDGEELVMCNDPSITLPVCAPHAWPWPLNICVDAGETSQQRDIMLFGAMTVTGVCLSSSPRGRGDPGGEPARGICPSPLRMSRRRAGSPPGSPLPCRRPQFNCTNMSKNTGQLSLEYPMQRYNITNRQWYLMVLPGS